jgi:hypothetical protein
MERRIATLLSVVMVASLLGTACRRSAVYSAPIELSEDSQLFVDDFLIEHLEGLTRVLNHPEKLTSIPNMDYGVGTHPRT